MSLTINALLMVMLYKQLLKCQAKAQTIEITEKKRALIGPESQKKKLARVWD